jgi:hypothetical protein
MRAKEASEEKEEMVIQFLFSMFLGLPKPTATAVFARLASMII